MDKYQLDKVYYTPVDHKSRSPRPAAGEVAQLNIFRESEHDGFLYSTATATCRTRGVVRLPRQKAIQVKRTWTFSLVLAEKDPSDIPDRRLRIWPRGSPD